MKIKHSSSLRNIQKFFSLDMMFLIYGGIFFYTFFFNGGILFQYASIAMICVYILFRQGGEEKPSLYIEKQKYQSLFLSALFFSLSLYLICISQLLQSYDIQAGKNTFLFFAALFYILSFTAIFSKIFQRFFQYILSKSFRKYLIYHTYSILTSFFVILGVLVLLYQYGFIGYQKQTESAVMVEREVVFSAKLPVGIAEEKVDKTFKEKQKIRTLFQIPVGLSGGDTGENVAKLQESLHLLGYYTGEISEIFDASTEAALKNVLRNECDFSENSEGIFNLPAKECIDSLEVITP